MSGLSCAMCGKAVAVDDDGYCLLGHYVGVRADAADAAPAAAGPSDVRGVDSDTVDLSWDEPAAMRAAAAEPAPAPGAGLTETDFEPLERLLIRTPMFDLEDDRTPATGASPADEDAFYHPYDDALAWDAAAPVPLENAAAELLAWDAPRAASVLDAELPTVELPAATAAAPPPTPTAPVGDDEDDASEARRRAASLLGGGFGTLAAFTVALRLAV